MSAFIELEGLTRRFGNRVAVEGLSLSIERGEVFGFLGPNGAGKTTTFHLLTGLLAPDAGRLIVDGVEARPSDPLFRSRLGVVFQQPSLDLKLTGRENLELGAALHGVPRLSRRDRIDETLRFFELAARAEEAVERYSGGLRRRLELGRVLLHRPEILVMDEPSQGLDQASLRSFWRELGRVRAEERTTILVTTHQPEEAEQCDRLAVIDGGRVIACGTPDELRKRVGGDVITIEADQPDLLLAEIAAAFSVPARIVEGRLVLECPRGHEIIPRLVERFPRGRLRSVGMRPPSLADVFVKLTGKLLGEAAA